MEGAKQRDRGMCVSLRIDKQLSKKRFDAVDGGGAGQERLQTERERFVVVETRVRRSLAEEGECIAQLLERGFIERLVTRDDMVE